MSARGWLAASTALALAAGLSGCAGIQASNRPLVVVTTNILGDVVEQVVGDHAEVLTLMAPNSDPHSFEISAQQAARIYSADLVVSNGLGLEEGLQRYLDTDEAKNVPQFVAGDVIDVLDYAEGDIAGAPDPHFWTDPARMIDVVDGIEDALIAELDGIDAAAIGERADAYRAQIEALDAEMAAAFDELGPGRRALVTNHHVFGYLAQRYDFVVIGAVIPSGTTLAAPSASDLRDLTSAITEAGVGAIFAESSSPDTLARVLADQAGLDVAVIQLYTESLTAEGEGADSYLDMMRVNSERIVTGLADR